jgi:hypothetical protein
MMKARIHQNIYGNWYGYLGTRRVEMFFGPAWEQERSAKAWLHRMNTVTGAQERQLADADRFQRMVDGIIGRAK